MKESTKEKLNKFCDIGLIILTCISLLFCGFCIGCKVKENVNTNDVNNLRLNNPKNAYGNYNERDLFLNEYRFCFRKDSNFKLNYDLVYNLNYMENEEYIDLGVEWIADNLGIPYIAKYETIVNGVSSFKYIYDVSITKAAGVGGNLYFYSLYMNFGEDSMTEPLFRVVNGNIETYENITDLSSVEFISDIQSDFTLFDIKVANIYQYKISFIDLLSACFELHTIDNYTLNEIYPINYMTYQNRESGYFTTTDSYGANSQTYIFKDGLFYNQAKLYTEIRINFNYPGYWYGTDGKLIKDDPTTRLYHYIPYSVVYRNTFDGSSKVYMNSKMKYEIIDNQDTPVPLPNEYIIVDDLMKDIKVIYYGMNFGGSNVSLIQRNNYENLNLYVDTSTYYRVSFAGDVFSLLGNAFGVFVPFFTMQIIPGLSVGLMLALPLVVVLIVVIFRVVKK